MRRITFSDKRKVDVIDALDDLKKEMPQASSGSQAGRGSGKGREGIGESIDERMKRREGAGELRGEKKRKGRAERR